MYINPNVLEQITTLTPMFICIDKKGNPTDDDTKKLYKTKIKAVMKRFDPQQHTLDFLVSNPHDHDVINMHMLNINSLGVHTAKSYYNSIARFLSIAQPISTQQTAYNLH